MNTPTIHRGLAAIVIGAILLTTACGDVDAAAGDATSSAAGCDADASIGAAMFGDPTGLPDSIAALSTEASDDLRASAVVDGEPRQAIYGLVSEAVRNVARHAAATTCHITVSADDASLHDPRRRRGR